MASFANASSEYPAHIIPRPFVFCLFAEHHVRGVKLHDVPVPEEHRASGEAAGLLDEVCDKDDRHLTLELLEHVLNAHGCDGVDGDGEFVQTKNLRLMRQGP